MTSVHISITESIHLDRCWVCPVVEGLHDHHVVPQSYGGTNGPTVTVCGGHHTLIHTMSLRPRSEWRFEGNPLQVAKLQYLTIVIANARARTKHLKRPMQLSNKLDVNRSAKLRAIQKLKGFSSLQKTIEWCIDSGYSKVTPLS